MPCGSCGNNQISLATGSQEGIQVLNHNDCEGITTDLLIMFIGIIECTRSSGRLQQAAITAEDANNTIELLKKWIEVKQQDPGTCEYQDKLPIVQAIVQKAILTGTC